MSFSITLPLPPSPSPSLQRSYTPKLSRPFVSSSSRYSLNLNPLNCFTRAEMSSVSGKGKKVVNVYDAEEQLAVSLADYTFHLSNKFVQANGAFTVVVSGGSLINSLRKLAVPPYVDTVEWSKWHVFWVDERVVPKDHVDSNYKLCYDGFLSKVPIPGGQVYAINEGAVSAEAAASDYERSLKGAVEGGKVRLSRESGFPKFDLILLGIGPDGHVASLFPGHPLAGEKKKWVAAITDSPKPPPERITFTFPVINSAAHVGVVVTGSGKAGPVRRALGKEENGEGVVGVLPVQLVSPEEELVWFMDKAAASKL